MDYDSEHSADRIKANWRARSRWATPPAELWLSLGAIDDVTTRQMLATLRAEPDSPLYLSVDSAGGDGDLSFRLYSEIRQRAAPTHAHVSGRCYSGALIVLLAADRRTADPRARFLPHNSNCRTSGYKTAAQLRNDAEWLAAMDTDMTDLISFRTRYPRWRLASDMSSERYFDCEEAWLFGILTEQPK